MSTNFFALGISPSMDHLEAPSRTLPMSFRMGYPTASMIHGVERAMATVMPS